MPTADGDVFVGFPSPSVGPFIMLVIRCTLGEVVMLLEFGANGGHEEWEPNWSAIGLDVRHRESPRWWGVSPKHRAACLQGRGC